MKLDVKKIPETIEIKVIDGPGGTTYKQEYIRYDLFDKVVQQRNLLVREPELIDALDVEQVIEALDGELEMTSGRRSKSVRNDSGDSISNMGDEG